MSGHNDCDCEQASTESAAHGTDLNWARWLDKRSEVRAAFVALSSTGKLKQYDELPTSIHELQENSKVGAKSAVEFVHTKDALWALVDGKTSLSTHSLSRLPARDLERFVNFVKFEDYMLLGDRRQHVGTFYLGDLVQQHGFSYAELFAVFALFGIGPLYAVQTYHKFAWDADRSRCQPRTYWNCPWASDC